MIEDEELRAEIGRHLMQPENYGKLDDANCTGIGVDHATKSYVIMYIKRDDEQIEDVMFGTNGSQDTTTLGSLFSEMIKGDSIQNAMATLEQLQSELNESYTSLPKPKVDLNKPKDEQVERISTEHQDSANMVLTSFRAAMRHYDRLKEGIKEEHFEMSISKTCPYSTTECHFVSKAKDN